MYQISNSSIPILADVNGIVEKTDLEKANLLKNIIFIMF